MEGYNQQTRWKSKWHLVRLRIEDSAQYPNEGGCGVRERTCLGKRDYLIPPHNYLWLVDDMKLGPRKGFIHHFMKVSTKTIKQTKRKLFEGGQIEHVVNDFVV